jgi:cytochrome c-type biogenesis protein CcsB
MMQLFSMAALFLYLLSTAGYVSYLFLQKDVLHRAGWGLLGAGFLANLAAILYEFMATGRFPVGNLQETLSVAACTLAGLFLAFQHRYRLRVLGVYAAPLVALIMAVSVQLPRAPSQMEIVFNNFWIIFHVVVIFIGNAAFALAAGAGILYLVQESAIKGKNHGFFFHRLPSLNLLDTVGYASIVVGFTMFTLGLITGFLYAKTVWGRFWSWDPKEVWSGVMWLFYAALLHERLATGWRGRKAAIMSIVGFGVLLFTFLGVNFLLTGHHGAFTRW